MIDTTDVTVGRRAVTLSDLVRIPLRRWPTVLVTAVIGLLAGFAWLWVVPASHEAVAVVAVRPVVADPFSYPGPGADRTVNMNVENGLATGTEVINAVAATTGRTPAVARAGLQVELPVGSQVLRFLYTGRSATEAVDGVNTAARTYLEVRGGLYEKQRAARLAAYDAAIKQVTDRQAAVRGSLPGSAPRTGSTPPGVTAAVEQLRALNEELAQLNQERAAVAAVDTTPGAITQIADQPRSSSDDSAPIYLMVGLLGGLLAGAIASYAHESVDRRIRSIHEAEEIVGRAALAVVRRPRRADDRPDTDLRYAALVLAEQLDRSARPAVLLSSRAGEGRDRLLTGLAAALVDQGYGIRVVHADERLNSASNGVPVASAGRDTRSFDESAGRPRGSAPVPRPAPGARPAPGPRPAPPDDREALTTAARLLLEEAGSDPAERTDRAATRPGAPTLVLVDAPPAESDERGVRAARDATAVLVVARDRTRTRELHRLTERLRLTGARTLGFVFLTGRR
ncbi:lipopolysaccharide biosynthesis protein [Plantactinospora sp. GCM10030261]|uniref:lipopolysaccharide biosynthesis protein n=1 Tax=Plantactinospora sp. GCM10030261 TaxID=3273420 RepID=UPI003620BFFD